AARVFIQFALQYLSVEFLPPFDLWHSEAMPYLLLFTLQCILLALMVWGAFAIPSARHWPRLGRVVCVFGLVYLASMILRLVIGLGGFSDRLWFEGAVPTAIHFVLIAYVLVFAAGLDNYNPDTRGFAVRILTVVGYPLVLVTGYLQFIWMLKVGAPLMFSAYLTVLIGATMILLHETFASYRGDWKPDKNELIADGFFLAFVQVGVPAVLKVGVLLLLVWLSGKTSGWSSPWPQQAPVLVQVLMMMVIAEFFRYWIHRASHTFIPLWKLHAVHHAATRLYTVNVGRFHPLDKTIQFVGDTFPFLLLGVSAEVFATYFVVYALNGFYQHSNASVKLGLFNWIIAGPELHRWHHSVIYREGNSNFGNNLIVWDSVFGTRYLPRDETVEKVGIGNLQWPGGFLAQLVAPFTTPTHGSSGAVAGETAPSSTKD
ncbi:MAG: sterol desaturase family protein, partial [Pseudomonadota bacterium]